MEVLEKRFRTLANELEKRGQMNGIIAELTYVILKEIKIKVALFFFWFIFIDKMKKLIRFILLILFNLYETIAIFSYKSKIYSHDAINGSFLRSHFNGTTLWFKLMGNPRIYSC